MSSEVKVPVLGESISEATIGQWLKQPGESVAADEPIASLETDKVAIEVMAPVAGVMGAHIAKEGDTVAVGALIGLIEAGSAALLLRLPPLPPQPPLLLLRLRAHRAMPPPPCPRQCAARCWNTGSTRLP